jgi:hypothetical protein
MYNSYEWKYIVGANSGKGVIVFCFDRTEIRHIKVNKRLNRININKEINIKEQY